VLVFSLVFFQHRQEELQNFTATIGYSVEQKDEPCVQCHRTSTPLQELPTTSARR